MSLSEARKTNLTIKQQVANGIDPSQSKKEKAQDTTKLFGTVAEQYYQNRKDTLAPKTYSRNYSAYNRDIKL